MFFGAAWRVAPDAIGAEAIFLAIEAVILFVALEFVAADTTEKSCFHWVYGADWASALLCMAFSLGDRGSRERAFVVRWSTEP